MSDDTIRAALDAATDAMRRATDRNGCVPPSPEDRAAAAVAVFLRQMDSVPLGNGFTFAALAAAVEEAARDSGGPVVTVEFDPVNKPKHYNQHPSGVEAIQVTEHMGFCLGNVMKYVWRADLKNGIEDLEKARWYLDREIARRKKAQDV